MESNNDNTSFVLRVPLAVSEASSDSDQEDGLHQEEEDPVFCLPLFPTLQKFFCFLQEDFRNSPPQTKGNRPCSSSPDGGLRQGGQESSAPPKQYVYHKARHRTFKPPAPSEDKISCQFLLPDDSSAPHPGEGRVHCHCLPLTQHVGFKVPGHHDCREILHLSFSIPNFS